MKILGIGIIMLLLTFDLVSLNKGGVVDVGSLATSTSRKGDVKRTAYAKRQFLDEEATVDTPDSSTTEVTYDVQRDSFSACLMVMDDGHRLPEWIAYHYYAVNLRTLVVAVDPRSKTSPTAILDRWRNRTNMTIVEWTDSNYTDQDLEDPTLARKGPVHRERQKIFYRECAMYLRQRNKTYTSFTDIDEFLTISADAINGSQRLMNQPGIVLQMIRKYSDAAKSREDDVPGFWYDQFQKSPCVFIPRVLFSAVPSTDEEVSVGVPEFLSPRHFDTIQWRYRASERFNGTRQRVDNWGKPIIDVSKVTDDDYRSGSETTHRVFKSICSPKKNLRTRYCMMPVGTQ